MSDGLVESRIVEGKEEWFLTREGRNILDGIERGDVYDMTEDQVKILQALGRIEDRNAAYGVLSDQLFGDSENISDEGESS